MYELQQEIQSTEHDLRRLLSRREAERKARRLMLILSGAVALSCAAALLAVWAR